MTEAVGVFIAQVDVESCGVWEEADEGAVHFFCGGVGDPFFLAHLDITLIGDEIGEILFYELLRFALFQRHSPDTVLYVVDKIDIGGLKNEGDIVEIADMDRGALSLQLWESPAEAL